jgi:L-ascorbate metabolism protein UlaG (beta-lactamase superfamily)
MRRAHFLILAAGISLSACMSSTDQWQSSSYPTAQPGDRVTATFLGVSTLVFEAGGHKIATDGFFTRPDMLSLFSVEPDKAEIARIVKAAKLDKVDAVITVHSHYDHAMDAPEFARLTGAELIGSPSTGQIAAGVGYKGASRYFDQNVSSTFAVPANSAKPHFVVKLVPSVHGDTGPLSDQGEIEAPLVPPAAFWDYREGGCFSVFIEFPAAKRRVLVHSSAGYVQGALKDEKADVVYLGIAPFNRLSDTEREEYWTHVVEAVGAKRVFPIHWDNMFDRLKVGEENLEALGWPLNDFEGAIEFLKKKAGERAANGREPIDIVLPKAWRKTDPFEGLK